MVESDFMISAFGEALLRYRRAAGLSQADLARKSGMSVRALRDLERGRASSAQERSSELLADALGLLGDERWLFLLLAQESRKRVTKPIDPTMLYSLPVVGDLVGREQELEKLRERVSRPAGDVFVVVGPPGIGKTSLAVAAVRLLGESYPDGCLALDLRAGDDRPMSTRSALQRLLVALGTPQERIPEDEPGRGELYRLLTRDRRVLLLLDNALDLEQIRPLLPAGRGCLTLVTSRRVLADLEASTLLLGPLSSSGAMDLLRGIVGDEVVRADEEAARELVSLCGDLPLAVRIAGNRLATRPHWSLGYLVRQLRDEHLRLDALAAGDLQVRSVFEMSFQRLSPRARKTFRRVAAVPRADFGRELAAVAAGVPENEAEAALAELVEVSLLTPVGGGSLRFHDLIRIFARERLETEEPQEVRDRLRDQVLSHLIEVAIEAGGLFFPDVVEVPADSRFPTREAARDWLEREEKNWAAAQRDAAALGWHREVLRLARSMHWYADSRELECRWDEVNQLGLDAARALGDRQAEVEMLNELGWAQYMCRNENEVGLATHTVALALAEEIGDEHGQAVAHCFIGIELMRLGRGEEGMAHTRRAQDLAMGFAFFDVQFTNRNALGVALRVAGRSDEALDIHQALLAEMDDHRGETNPEMERWVRMLLLENIGICLARLGRWREAAARHREARALTTANQIGYHEAEQAVYEGVAWREAGEQGLARECLLFARDLFEGPVYLAERERVEVELDRLA
ncbi:NB-ARC domain-containing protein [Lentzea sp. NPDC059081]|uniref:NB-ARC domain-containing protein n=1 Tax=Lentzea sp. NPDC059081 TaxID=3346719 RepID=UPI0036B4F518